MPSKPSSTWGLEECLSASLGVNLCMATGICMGEQLGRLEPHLLKSGPAASGACSFAAPFPSCLWLWYFTEIHREGVLVSVDRLAMSSQLVFLNSHTQEGWGIFHRETKHNRHRAHVSGIFSGLDDLMTTYLSLSPVVSLSRV